MSLSALAGLLAFGVLSNDQSKSVSEPFFHQFYIVLCAIQLCIAIYGVYSARSFLKLMASARTILEILTWILLVALVLFALYFMFFAIGPFSHGMPPDLFAFAVFAVLVTVVFYGAPLAVMLIYLRKPVVRNAMVS